MPKKTATTKPSTKSKATVRSGKAKLKAKPKLAKKAKPQSMAKPTAKTGMWKLLELKNERIKKLEELRKDGSHQGPGNVTPLHSRGPAFSKFAGPRRKVG
ncbi:MAG: hypothetical protein AB7F86_09080 [Bdellovibrionales bacterium]